MANPNLIQQEQIDGLSGGGALTPANHRVLDQLVHNPISETGFIEPIYNASNQPTSIILWSNAGKTIKRYEELITYTSGLATQVIARRYDGTTNNVVTGETITLAPSYTGGIINNITATLT